MNSIATESVVYLYGILSYYTNRQGPYKKNGNEINFNTSLKFSLKSVIGQLF